MYWSKNIGRVLYLIWLIISQLISYYVLQDCLSYPNRSLTFGLHVGRPEGEVVPEELHDERRVLVALLGQRVQLRDGVVEGGLGQAARAVGRVQDLVVKHGEVEGQAQPEKKKMHTRL